MNVRNKIIAAGAVAAVGLGTFGAMGVYAATATGTGQSLAQAIATKFGLKEADVQAVIDTKHDAARADRTKAYEAKLDAAVKAGTITSDQKAKILAKRTELEAARTAARDSFKDKTEAERKTAMEAERAALTKWATDNKIPENLLMFGGRGMGGHGMYGGHGMEDAPAASPSTSPAN